jgi:phage terminase large subunit
MAKQIWWDKLKEKLKELRWVDSVNEAELKITLKNKSKIQLKGADSPDSLRGVGLSFLVLDEFQDIEKRAWTEVLRPTLSDQMGHALFLGTPRGIGSFSHEMFTEAQTKENWGAHTYRTVDGGIVHQSEIEQAKQEMDEQTFEQEYLASFTTWRKSVAYNFKRDLHILDYQGPKDIIHVGQDFNIQPATAAIAVIDRDVHFIDEICIDGSNTQEICDELNRRYPNSTIISYPDPAGKQRRSSAGGKTDISIIQNNGIATKFRSAHTPVKDRVNALNTKLKNANGEIGMYVAPKCKNIIRSLERLSYKEDTSVIEKDGNEHMFDAVSYLIDYLYPVRTIHTPTSSQTFRFRGGKY